MQQLRLSKRVPTTMTRVALAVALVLATAVPAQAGPGDLDSSFGHGGLVHTDLGGLEQANALGVRHDGHVLVAGDVDLNPQKGEPGRHDFAVAGFTPRGALDRDFADRGRLSLALGGQEGITAMEVERYRTVVGGQQRLLDSSVYSTYGQLALARLGTDGKLDAGFGEDGWVTLPQTRSIWTTPAVIQVLQYGELVAVGPIEPLGDTHTKIVFAHLYDDGSPNQNFAPGGVKIVDFNGNDGWPTSFAVDPRGGLLVAGAAAADFQGRYPLVVQRFFLDGTVDTSFGAGGVARIGMSYQFPGAIAFQRDGAAIVSFSAGPYGADGGRLVRLLPNGTPDASFGQGGVASTPQPGGIAVDRSDRIIVGSGFSLVRHLADGTRDRSFKTVTLPRAYGAGAATHMEITRSGAIVVAGTMFADLDSDPYEISDYDFALARFHGGDDVRPPRIVMQRACSHGALRFRLRDDAGRVRSVVGVDGRRVLRTARKRVRLRLSAGRHRVVVRARDSSDNVAVQRRRVACG